MIYDECIHGTELGDSCSTCISLIGYSQRIIDPLNGSYALPLKLSEGDALLVEAPDGYGPKQLKRLAKMMADWIKYAGSTAKVLVIRNGLILRVVNLGEKA